MEEARNRRILHMPMEWMNELTFICSPNRYGSENWGSRVHVLKADEIISGVTHTTSSGHS
jgi:hypothetical protein